jgi:hypothetical protein
MDIGTHTANQEAVILEGTSNVRSLSIGEAPLACIPLIAKVASYLI